MDSLSLAVLVENATTWTSIGIKLQLWMWVIERVVCMVVFGYLIYHTMMIVVTILKGTKKHSITASDKTE